MKRLLCWLGVAILLVLAWTGLYGGFSQLNQTHTLGQEMALAILWLLSRG